MRLVVDANVIVSSLITRGVAFEVFKVNSILRGYEFYAPDYLLSETLKHKEEIIEEAGITEKAFFNALDFLMSEITVLPKDEFDECIPKALEMLKSHVKDAPYLALALKLECNIFSGDKKLRALCPDKVLTPRELLDGLLPKR